jgi:VWFA-related protein
MRRAGLILAVFAVTAATLPAQQPDEPVVFRSDVSLVRVDAQVLDGNRPITHLNLEDFVLRENGRVREIRNFASEKMPVDLLFLLDVSASMRPHVQRIANAAHNALQVLADNDRIAMMVFDRTTRVRLPFRNGRQEAEREFDNLLRQEGFRGGTDITRGMLDAADYMERNARREARRAIVILTDDETQMERDDARVEHALERADAIMSALIAPDAMAGRNMGGYPGGGGMGRRGRMGGGGLGGIILPGGIPGSGGGIPGGGGGGGTMGGRTHSAGTSEIARDSGGDSFPVDDSSALEDTLTRIRQRYALYFQLPPGARKGQQRTVDISLSDTALRRYPNAEVRFRHSYIAPSDGPPGTDVAPEPTSVSRVRKLAVDPDETDQPAPKHRPAVSGPGGTSAGPVIVHDRD